MIIDGKNYDAELAVNLNDGSIEITFKDACPFIVGQSFKVCAGEAIYMNREVTAVSGNVMTMTLIPANSTERQLKADVDFLTMQGEALDEDNTQNRADIDYCLMMLENEGDETNEETIV